MKKIFYSLTALGLLFTSCTSDEPVANNTQEADYTAANSFLTVKLRPTNSGTRADDGYTPESEPGNGTYVDGTAIENSVSRVRFFFFDKSGNKFKVRQNADTEEYDNYIDWYPNTSQVGDSDHKETVEKTLNATLGLTFDTSNDERPAQIVAIANPTDAVLNYQSSSTPGETVINGMSLSELQGVVHNYLPYQTADKKFVMSNSVYVDNDQVVYATAVTKDNFATTLEAAQKNPVTIYIERVLARVDFGINMNEDIVSPQDYMYKVGSYTVNDYVEKDGQLVEKHSTEAIYVKFLGWNVTATTKQSRLIKDINPEWDVNDLLGEDEPWNIPAYHRSFWAINPENVNYQYGNFGKISDFEVVPDGQYAMGLGLPAANNFVTTYLQENAAPYSPNTAAPTTPSEVIIAAQLCDEKGNPLTLCEWGYQKYTLNGLKNQIARNLNNLYYLDEDASKDNNQVWKQITPDMIDFATTDPAGEVAGDKSYNVYAVLTSAASQLTWKVGTGESAKPFEGNNIADQVNRYIRGIIAPAMVWNSGLTYYFFDIRHLATGDNAEELIGYLGVVRNHIYRTTVTSVKGLGTPVYDPNLEIIPEKTSPAETIIDAKIEILSWRLVESSYELNW